MPPVKINHVVSFSSEDSVHVANNILSTDTTEKWKCQYAGEKQAIVVLQLEKASQITAVDIGNEHSAYIEVLVSRSSNTDEFKALLVNSAFMTPLESRQNQNINKVRMFTKDQLSKPECMEKWDRVKIVCSQPFNKHVQFGLSFITLHSNTETDTNRSEQSNIGRFIIRPESPDHLSVGSLFAKRKEIERDKKPTAAAAIRDAASFSSLAAYGSPDCRPKLKNRDNSTNKKKLCDNSEKLIPKDRNRDELFYNSDEEKRSEKIDNVRKKEKNDAIKFWGIEEEFEKNVNKKGEKKRTKSPSSHLDDGKKKTDNNIHNRNVDSPHRKKKEHKECDDSRKRNDTSTKNEKAGLNISNSNRKNDTLNTPKLDRKGSKEKNNNKRKCEENIQDTTKAKKTKLSKPFHELLEGVTLVISGIQNPDRGYLRTMSLSMGAKYKPDWDDSCTHLICAFPNTPKFNQVKGKGKIVKQSWIEQCHKEKKRLPWRRFALDKSDLNKDESEDEIHELVNIPPTTSRKPVTNDLSDNECNAEGSDTEERISKILERKKREKVLKEEKRAQKERENEKKLKKKIVSSTDDETLSGGKRAESSTGLFRAKINEKNVSPKNDRKEKNKQKLENLSTDDSTDEESLNTSSTNKNQKNIYEADTEEETDLIRRFKENNRLLDLFNGDKFYVDQDFDKDTYTTLCTYIKAFNGKCVSDLTGNVDIIVTTKENSRNLKEINRKAKCLDQEWILQTRRKHTLVPMNNFVF